MPALVEKRRGSGVSYEIRFTLNRERKTLFLGQRKDAKMIFEMFVRLLESCETCSTPPAYITSWVENLDNKIYDRLVSFGLVARRPGQITIAALYDQWLGYPVDRKENTLLNHRTAFKRVLDFFPPDTLVGTITEEDALRFKQYLQARSYAPATITGIFRKLSGWFTIGRKLGLVLRNPFENVRCDPMENEARKFYVKPEWYPKLLKACPNQDWRTLITLARIGGLRVDSETSVLQWDDVDFENNLLTIHSPKTERYPGKDRRIIPLFPELREELRRQSAEDGGTGYVLPNFRSKNSRQQMYRIVFKAGLRPWDKLFNNMRASREMDLLESFPAHVVSAWMGHSIRTEQKHYVYAREEDYAKGANFTNQ